MKEYSFHIDTEHFIWKQETIQIEAENKEDAIKIAKKYFKKEDPSLIKDSVGAYLFETVSPTTDSTEDSASRELYDDEYNLLKDNRLK